MITYFGSKDGSKHDPNFFLPIIYIMFIGDNEKWINDPYLSHKSKYLLRLIKDQGYNRENTILLK